MSINHISSDILSNTGNKKIDEQIDFLLQMVGDDIKSIVNNRGRIYCKSIDFLKARFLKSQPIEIKRAVEYTLDKVRESLKSIFTLNSLLKSKKNILECIEEMEKQKPEEITSSTLSILLKKCANLKECEDILGRYGKMAKLDIFGFNIMLNKAKNISDCKYIIEKYGEGIDFNTITLNIVIKNCSSLSEYKDIKDTYFKNVRLDIISDTSLLDLIIKRDKTLKTKKKEIKEILFMLDLWDIDEKARRILILTCKPFINFIRWVIKHHNLQNLAFLL